MWETILETLASAGPVVALIAILILAGAAREWWVWGYVYRQQVKETEFWRERHLSLLEVAEKTVEVASDLAEETP